MSVTSQPQFEGGANIAMKVPAHVFDPTVLFYRDVLRLPLLEERQGSVVFQFGASRLWLDRAEHLSQAEIWLEVTTDDAPEAAEYLSRRGTVRRDEVEALPADFEGFWICNPADVIHLVSARGDDD
jgi:hypothetical protein